MQRRAPPAHLEALVRDAAPLLAPDDQLERLRAIAAHEDARHLPVRVDARRHRQHVVQLDDVDGARGRLRPVGLDQRVRVERLLHHDERGRPVAQRAVAKLAHVVGGHLGEPVVPQRVGEDRPLALHPGPVDRGRRRRPTRAREH
ncbi:MAG: hypothetical protein M5U28_08545 [Sandaracinaceae bacterium]|nr:hypothetical protein [Sandaracinaceae bacterium]